LTDTPELLLASASRHRAKLLERLRLPFQVRPADVDETPLPRELPGDMAGRLAEAKARAIHRLMPGAVVIGSDQVASLDGAILRKPGGPAAAQRQLQAASGRMVEFDTGVCVCTPDGSIQLENVPFRVQFRQLSAAGIAAYLEAERPYDCAGSFKAEGLGIVLFERLEGDDPTALIGLPLIALSRMLRQAGYPLPG
jgi:septum formation protein